MPASFGGFGAGQATPNRPSEETIINSSTPFHAASDGDLPLLIRSLSHLAISHTVADENGYTLLHAAASYGQLPVLEWLLSQEGTNVNVADNEGDTPLHHCERTSAARMLVERGGADWAVRNKEGKTAREAKEEELAEDMEDDGEEEDDEDREKLREMAGYLKGLER